jgi:hypothetical protein
MAPDTSDSAGEDLVALLISQAVDRRKLRSDDIHAILGAIMDGEKAEAERCAYLRLQRWTEDQ